MMAKTKTMAAGAARMLMAGPGMARVAVSSPTVTAAGAVLSPAAFCCKAYDYNNNAGQGCAPVIQGSANACSGTYFECGAATFLCGPESLVDPAAGNTIYGPSCECSTQVQGLKQ